MTDTKLLYPRCIVSVGGGAPIKVIGGRMRLDTFGIPYGDGSVDVALVDAIGLDDLDPRNPVRVTIAGSIDPAATPRPFDLTLRERSIDHRSETITLRVATDEALLIDYSTLVEDDTAREHEKSLRAVVDSILSRIGAQLEPGSADADVTAAWDLANLFSSPSSGEASLGKWTASVDATVSVSQSSTAYFGVQYLVIRRSDGAGVAAARWLDPITVTEGRLYSYTFAAWPTVTGDTRAEIVWFNADSRQVRESRGEYVTAASTGWDTFPSVTAVAPPGAAYASVRITYLAPAAGAALRADAHTFVEGAPVAPFWGLSPSDEYYDYEWSDASNQSESYRIAKVERLPELFEWEPGTSAWDFLQPLLTAAGMRLFCDELRAWRLVAAGEYTIPGYKVLAVGTLTDGRDTISREARDTFATGIVVAYHYRSRGVDKVAYDVAGTPEKVVRIDYDRPYPGPGAAAAILARRDGTGRVQEVTALADWTLTPGVASSVNLPAAPEQRGKVSSVEWMLDDTGTMQVGTGGLIDILPTSWYAVDPAEAWTDPPDIAWAEWA